MFEVVSEKAKNIEHPAKEFSQRFTSLIHRIQAPEDALALTTPTPAPANADAAVRAGETVSRLNFVRFRRLLNSMTDPDTKFCSSPSFLGLQYSYWYMWFP